MRQAIFRDRPAAAIDLFSLPASTGGGVFQDDASGREVIANAVARGEVTTTTGGVPLFDELTDLVDGHGRLLFLSLSEGEDPQHRVESVKRGTNTRCVAAPQRSGVYRGVEGANEFEHGAQRRRGVQVGQHGIGKGFFGLLDAAPHFGVCSRGSHSIHPSQAVGQSLERLFHLAEAGPGEIQLLAVMRREQERANR